MQFTVGSSQFRLRFAVRGSRFAVRLQFAVCSSRGSQFAVRGVRSLRLAVQRPQSSFTDELILLKSGWGGEFVLLEKGPGYDEPRTVNQTANR
jgi:hypothetical protein